MMTEGSKGQGWFLDSGKSLKMTKSKVSKNIFKMK